MEDDPRYHQMQREAEMRLESREHKDRRRARDYTPLEVSPTQFLSLTGRSYEYPGQPTEGRGADFTDAMMKFMDKVDEEVDINPSPVSVHIFAMEKCMRDLKGRKVIPATRKQVSFEEFVAWLYQSTFPE